MSAQRHRNKELNLLGRVAVVTGASRGAGRAIVAVLGEHGATVYVSGRGVRGQPTTDDLPGTIDDMAEEVTRRGGTGIPMRCDHANEHDVEVLFKRVREEQGRLDILVNNAGEVTRVAAYFWKASLRLWDAMFERGLKAHLLATYFAGDPHVMRKTGKAFDVGELAREYRFSDIDGSRVPPFPIVESFVNMVKKFDKRPGPRSRR
jgi:NAD(P)-dependent dehydrogenase (short-subunit alcohol dehydrogenase family)